MDAIKKIFNGKGTKSSSDHHGNNKEKIVKSHHRKNAPASQSPEITIQTDIDESGLFLKVENPSAARSHRSNSDVSPSLSRRTKAEKYMQMNVDIDLDCDSTRDNQQQFLRSKKQRKRSNSTTTEKEIMRNLNRISHTGN